MSEPSTEILEVAAEPPVAPVEGGSAAGTDGLVEQDLLVEDVSIDGMCGVY